MSISIRIVLALVAVAACQALFQPKFGGGGKKGAAPKAPPAPVEVLGAEGFYGSLAPLGFFDPLGLATDKTEFEIRKYREAELKHGRVAMLACLGFLVNENTNLLFDGKISGPAIYQFQIADTIIPQFWTGVLFFIALVEAGNIQKGWESPEQVSARLATSTKFEKGASSKGVAGLKDSYINGDLGFDPLGLKGKLDFDDMRVKEVQNGRLAMIGAAGLIAQELVTGAPVFQL